MTEHTVRVEVTNQSSSPDVDLQHWAQVASDTLIGEGIRSGNLDVIFVDAEEMADLNRQFMGKEGPTDVLSFPMDEPESEIDLSDGGLSDAGVSDGELLEEPMPLHLGDVVVCPSIAEAQAPGHCGDLAAELTLLIVHGVLHVLGHDHAEPEEAASMIAREEQHMARCGFIHPGPVLP